MPIFLDPILEKAKLAIAAHKLPLPGQYARYRVLPGREVLLNAYGCADAANLLYTINEMPTDSATQTAMIQTLQAFQNPQTGLFSEGEAVKFPHVPFHTTAHCLGALELFDAQPLAPVRDFKRYEDPAAVAPFLNSLDWNAGRSAHYAAGLFSTLFLTKKMTLEWQNAFFDCLDSNVDRKYGVSRAGAVDAQLIPRWHHMGDWFHLLFCYFACHRPFPFADRVVDYCLDLYARNDFPDSFGKGQRFLDIDWAFTIHRSALQSGHRLPEVRAQLLDFAQKFTAYLLASPLDEPQWDDMHLMFGSICGLAELQIALPGELISTRPLRQILERRPFI